MRCSESREMLPLLAAGFLNDMETFSVKRHLESCDRCLNEARCYAGLVEGIRREHTAANPPIPVDTDALERKVWLGTRCSGAANRPVRNLFALSYRVAAAVVLCTGGLLGLRIFYAEHAQRSTGDRQVTMREIWKISSAAQAVSTPGFRPVAADGFIYMVKKDGNETRIAAYDAASGAERWVTRGGNYSGRFITSDGVLYAVGADRTGEQRTIYALDGATGRKRWHYHHYLTGVDWNPGSPEIHPEGLLWLSGDELYSFNKASGTVRWHRTIAGRVRAARIKVSGDRICAVTADSVHYIDAASGAQLRAVAFDDRMSGLWTPLLSSDGGRLFIGHRKIDNTGAVYCFDIAGNPLWHCDMPRFFSMDHADGTLLCRSQAVYALDARSGDLRWKVDAGGCSPTASSCGYCFVSAAGDEGALLQLNLTSGKILNRYTIGGACNGLVLDHGTGYLLDNRGTLHALDLRRLVGCGAGTLSCGVLSPPLS